MEGVGGPFLLVILPGEDVESSGGLGIVPDVVLKEVAHIQELLDVLHGSCRGSLFEGL